MYTNGLNPKIQELYPKVSFPVSRGTPSINELPFWDHNQVWSIDSLNKIVSSNLKQSRRCHMFFSNCIYFVKIEIIDLVIEFCDGCLYLCESYS